MLGPVLSAIPFVHPSLAAVAVACGLIPVVVHLVNRRRYRRVAWAAMQFLEAAQRRSARRVRLEHWILLLMRVGLVVLLGLAVARPYVPSSALLGMRSSRSHRILLLDNSLSMNARGGRPTRFDAARSWAQQLIASLPPADAVSIVTLAGPAEAVIAHAAYDRRIIRDRLASIRPAQRAADTAGALEIALEIFRDSDAPAGNRTVYLVSDFRSRVWRGETDNMPTPAVLAARRLADALADSGVDLQFVRAAGSLIDNVSVTRLSSETLLTAAHMPVRFVAEVTNFGPSATRDLTLQIRRDGNIIRRERLETIEPGESTAATISMELTGSGTHTVEARVAGPEPDALQDDDTRFLSIEVRESIPVLLVDGRPEATSLGGEAGFLTTALAPRVSASPEDRDAAVTARWTRVTPIDPKVISLPEFDAEALPDYDVVVLCNVPRLSPNQWRQLEHFVSRGGGLLVASGDLISTVNYNRYGFSEGGGLMPGKLGGPLPGGRGSAASGPESVGLVRTAEPTPLNGTAEPTFFEIDGLTHPIVTGFAGHPKSGLFLARVDRYLPIDVDPERGEIVLRFKNGDPALVAARFGRGSVVFFGTSASMAWTNLPAKGDYVSLMFNTVAFLSRRMGDHRNIVVGETLTEPLTPAQGSWPLRVTAADGTATDGRVVATGESLALAYGPVERAGVLRVSVGPEVRSFAANVDPACSDLRTLDADELAEALARPVRVLDDVASTGLEGPHRLLDAAPAAKASELAALGLCLVLALLVGEMWLAARFGSRGVAGGRSSTSGTTKATPLARAAGSRA